MTIDDVIRAIANGVDEHGVKLHRWQWVMIDDLIVDTVTKYTDERVARAVAKATGHPVPVVVPIDVPDPFSPQAKRTPLS